MDPIESLRRLLEAVRKQGADIAPTYSEYLQLAFAIATDCGEAGRGMFHELCAFSPKYRQRDADRLFDSALRDGRGEVHLGTAFHLARQAGVRVEFPAALPENVQNVQNVQHRFSLTHTCANNKVETALPPDPDVSDRADPLSAGSDPAIALPFLEEYPWPRLLSEVRRYGKTPAQRDVLFIASIAAIGACMGKSVRCAYGGKLHSPCLQLFIVAPPASGKGALSFVRKFVELLHQEIRCQVEKQLNAYRHEKAAYEAMGRKKNEADPPQPPKNRLFIIPGNNTGTGILQNLIDSDGAGIIFETEADTVSTAIGADYGHWSDTLRKAFDHDPLSYNRRTDREYREVARSYLSVILSGTPAQVCPLIPSAENGLFSRQLFYYMPAVRAWQDQFDWSEKDVSGAFEALGREWKSQLDLLREHGVYDLLLTAEQKAAFNSLFSRLFCEAFRTGGGEMSGSVTRLAVMTCRILSVTAVLRMLEAGGPQSGFPFVRPSSDIPADNLKDGIVTRWEVGVTDADFQAVLALVSPFYRHAMHILSFLPSSELSRRSGSDRMVFFSFLPESFTRTEMLEIADRLGVNSNTADSWIRRLKKDGLIGYGEEAGSYRKRI